MLFENEFYQNIYHTVILVISLGSLSTLLYFIMLHAFKLSTDPHKMKNRMIYVTLILFIIFCAKIWVQGFTNIFYGLSLVSAGLVVTNKETIMNLVGWGIISWRGLFAEGDYIEISGNKGVVCDLGIFYFKLLEGNSLDITRSSGKFLKIPNGFVINNVVKQVSLSNQMIERHLSFMVPLTHDITIVKSDIETMLKIKLSKEVVQPVLPRNKESNLRQKHLNYAPLVTTNFSLDKPNYIKFNISYYCCETEKLQIENNIRFWVINNLLK